nr:GNAT family N-acetyltransferase [Bacteroidota bacterium]
MINPSTKIETQRLILEKYTYELQQNLYECFLLNEKRLQNSFPTSVRLCLDETKGYNYIQSKVFDFNARTSFAYAIIIKDARQYIGQVSITKIDEQIPMAELAYFIDKGYEGKGMMSEAFEAILEELFVKHHFEKLSLHMATNNSRSLKLAETHGFMREGLHRKCFRNYYNELIDVYSYGIIKAEYFK